MCVVCGVCNHTRWIGNYWIERDGKTLCMRCGIFRDLEEKVRRLEERIQELEDGK